MGTAFYAGFAIGCLIGPKAVERVGHIRCFAGFAALGAAGSRLPDLVNVFAPALPAGLDLQQVVWPAAGDRFFLIAPMTDDYEGHYGYQTSGTNRRSAMEATSS